VIQLYLAMLETEEEQTNLAEIYEQHKSHMLRYALKMLGNSDLAEDAVHDAFLAIIRHKNKYFSLPHREMRATAVVITKNKCLDMLKKVHSDTDVSIADIEHRIESNDESVESQVILTEEYNAICNHISSLDEMSRLVLEMKYRIGMSYKEIGEALNLTPKHVDTKIMRAKAKVRKLSTKTEDEANDK